MSFKKSFGLVSLGALVSALTYGCSSTPSNNGGGGGDDSGVTGSDGGKHDGGDGGIIHVGDGGTTGDGGGGGACAPGDVSTFMPPAYIPAKHSAGACNAQQITALYDGCLAPNSTMTTCAPFTSATATPANKACFACAISADSASAYGALVEQKGLVSINIPGCVEIKDTAGGLACAKAYQASEKCNDAACAANCPVTDDASFQLYQACVQQASANGCKTYSTAAACANAEQDGGAAADCFKGQSFQDLYNNVVPVFCL